MGKEKDIDGIEFTTIDNYTIRSQGVWDQEKLAKILISARDYQKKNGGNFVKAPLSTIMAKVYQNAELPIHYTTHLKIRIREVAERYKIPLTFCSISKKQNLVVFRFE